MTKERIAVLGAGLAGLAAASQLADQDVVIYEKRSHWGGHASSRQIDGFTFDEGPHISFTKNQHVQEIFSDAVDGQYQELPGIAFNYFQGFLLKHPTQFHLQPLPPDIKTACLVDFIQARLEPPGPIVTYRDWCYSNLGKSFSETFVRKYTRKYWTMELEDLTVDWIGPRIHSPSLEQMISGAMSESTENHNYIDTFRYPLKGGFASFGAGLATGSKLETGYQIVMVDPELKTLSFSNGEEAQYDWLISSLPLPDLIAAIPTTPPQVQEAVKRLKWTSHFLVNLGICGEGPQEGYWIYYYDEEIPFSRVCFPSRFSPFNAPEGHFSLQAEIVHAPHKPLGDSKAVTEETIEWLQRVGLIPNKSDIVLVDNQDIQYANVIFDLERSESLSVVHHYLQDKGISVCGRYGEWAYLWTDGAVLSGEKAAEEVRRSIASRT